MQRAYAATQTAESPWTRLNPTFRRRLIFGLWVVTQAGLFAGLLDPGAYEAVIGLTIAHALLFLVLLNFRPLAFPAQLRIAYVGWLALGTYVPALSVMMLITTAGLLANLLFGYCPLARMLYLLPWNRDQPLTARLAVRAFLTPPRPGRFTLEPEAAGTYNEYASL